LNLDKAIKNLEKKLWPGLNTGPSDYFFYSCIEFKSHKWDVEKEEVRRLQRIEEIRDKANDLRVARCEAKMKEVGGLVPYLELIEIGKWSDADEWTPIEEEYHRLAREQFEIDWFREHGKPYRMEDDPNAKF
jgi:hypothetical protein